eukprot:GILI01016978.1.p1 GENE.GILI01016978.1~~GILI01016978.1.p1  ORF type:complete len:510 (+),score=181.03 GILI01016978.1:203-1531(+)
MQMLIEQLTNQNEKIQEQLGEAVRNHKIALANASQQPKQQQMFVDPMLAVAHEEEKKALQAEIDDLQSMLEELETENKDSKESMLELEALVEELEEENESKEKVANEANKKAKTVEIELKSATALAQQYKKQIDTLQQQITKNDVAMLDKAHGDELLSSLTKLHMEHQSLQFQHNELLDLHSRMEVEKTAQMELLNERIAELQLEKEQERLSTNTMNSYCWRLLNVAHLAAEGTPFVDDKEGKNGALSLIREHQVDSAVKSLTAFVTSRSGKPPTVIESTQSAKSLVGTFADDEENSNKKPSAAQQPGKDKTEDLFATANATSKKLDRSTSDVVCENENDYKQKIRDLEKIITTKDAQRDIIVDTKLKRIQELVLRLQGTNLRLAEEVRDVVSENHNLFEIIKKEPKLSKSLNKTKYQPVSEEEVMLRALTTPPIQRPLGHI